MEITNSLSNVHVFLPLPPPRTTSGTLKWLSLLNTTKTTFKSYYCLPDQVSSTRLAESCDTPFWNFPLASGQSLAQRKVPFFFSFVLSEAMPAEGSDSPMLLSLDRTVVWPWVSTFHSEAQGSPSTPKLHGIMLLTLFARFFSNYLKSMFSVKVCFKHTWCLCLTAEGKGVQDLVWLHPGAPGGAHVMPDTGVKACQHLKEGIFSLQDFSIKKCRDQPEHGSHVDARHCRMTAEDDSNSI